MNQFTIKDIENLSGIKAHTWRIWEQRYGLGIPQRKDSNHRFYDNENLKQILRISYLYHSGYKISRIAGLREDDIKRKAQVHNEHDDNPGFFIKELVEASIDFDEEHFRRILEEVLNRMSFEEAIIKVLYPYQEKIGVLWLTDHVIPAQEHFTSNLIRQKLAVAIDDLPSVTNDEGKTWVLFTPENEQHEIPLQFIHYMLKKNGNKIIYFGSHIKLQHLKEINIVEKIDFIAFHLLTVFKVSPDVYLQQVAEMFPGKKIVMSGTLTRKVGEARSNVILLQSLEELLNFYTNNR